MFVHILLLSGLFSPLCAQHFSPNINNSTSLPIFNDSDYQEQLALYRYFANDAHFIGEIQKNSEASDRSEPNQGDLKDSKFQILLGLWRSVLNFELTTTSSHGPFYSSNTADRFASRVVRRLTTAWNMRDFFISVREAAISRITCTICHLLSALYTNLRFSTDVLLKLSKSVCIRTYGQSALVCNGLVENFATTLAYIRVHSKLRRAEICGVLIGAQCAPTAIASLSWQVPLPTQLNYHYHLQLDNQTKTNFHTSDNDSPLRVLHFTDVHLDAKYRAFARAKCSTPVCCRESSEGLLLSQMRFNDTQDLLKQCAQVLASNSLSASSWIGSTFGSSASNSWFSSSSNSQSLSSSLAGLWGDYDHCDTPVSVMHSLLEHLQKQVRSQKVDYIFWTGDVPAHDVWSYTRQRSLSALRELNSLIKKKLDWVKILPAIGNHETVPINAFAPVFYDPRAEQYTIDESEYYFNEKIGRVIRKKPIRTSSDAFLSLSSNMQNADAEFPDTEVGARLKALSNSWLYEETAKSWSAWLPESALKDVRRSGNYAIELSPGIRAVVLNTNYCARLNPWMMYDPNDPGGQLRFLVKQLWLAENSNQRVILIGHVAPDHRECAQPWLAQFERVLLRFQHVISSQFYGHTHRDEFRVYYGDSSKFGQSVKNTVVSLPSSTQNLLSNTKKRRSVLGYALISPAVTAYSHTNSAYRIYDFRKSDASLQDVKTYFYNVTEANLQPNKTPKWAFSYSMKQKYGWLSNCSGTDCVINENFMHSLLARMWTNRTLYDEFNRNYFVLSDYEKTRNTEKKRLATLMDLQVSDPLHTRPYGLIIS